MRRSVLYGIVLGTLLALPGFAISSYATSASAAVACPLQTSSSWNMYTADTATLSACDLVSYPVASVTTLPGGGTQTTYATPDGPTSEITPPANFDPATASPAQLAEYGIPPEPPASNATALANWHAMINNMHTAGPAQSQMIGTNASQFKRNPTYQTNGPTGWAGYYANESSGYFHYAYGEYVEPTQYSSACSSSAAVPWVGIGGVNTSLFGQAGTEIGNQSGGGQHQFWYETNVGTVNFPNFYATAGSSFEVDVSYNTSNDTYSYFGYNLASGVYHTYTQYSSSYGGATTDFIMERLGGTNLSNFATMTWEYAASAVQQYPLYDYPYVNYQLTSNGAPSGGYDLATANDTSSPTIPSPVSSSGNPFYIHQDRCN